MRNSLKDHYNRFRENGGQHNLYVEKNDINAADAVELETSYKTYLAKKIIKCGVPSIHENIPNNI